jgi:predicted small lipoprotein YifL
MEPQDTRRRALVQALLALAVAGALAACGKKGPPEPPEDADPKYPRTYPSK